MTDIDKKITVLIPCLNEEDGIGMVLDHLPKEGLAKKGYSTETIVIDNNCSDKTAEIAKSKGALVVKERRRGKGRAMMKGFSQVSKDTDYVVMIDGDASYDIKEIFRLIEPLENGFGDAIVGSRLHGKIETKSMPTGNRWGNWFFTFLARVGYDTNVTDVCSGFFAWKYSTINKLKRHIKSNSFSLEMEMIAKMAKMNFGCYSVPISYNLRNGQSSLRPISDGAKILKAWARYLNWKP